MCDVHFMSGRVKHMAAYKGLAVQVVLAAGAVILAAIFVVTSFGGDGPSSSRRPPTAQQVHPCHLLVSESHSALFLSALDRLSCHAMPNIAFKFSPALMRLWQGWLT